MQSCALKRLRRPRDKTASILGRNSQTHIRDNLGKGECTFPLSGSPRLTACNRPTELSWLVCIVAWTHDCTYILHTGL